MNTRSLTPTDFDAVVGLDQHLNRTSRRDWFERRLQAALRLPARHIQVAAEIDGEFAGFVLARAVAGDFGRPLPTLLMEAISVDPARAGRGVGRGLLTALTERMRSRGLTELQTDASWRDHGILRFLDAAGFELAPRHVLVRGTQPRRADEDEDLDQEPHTIRTIEAADLDGVCAVDRRATGVDRSMHLRERLEDLGAESAVHVSLVAIEDGHCVGYLMARVDSGDFGRIDHTAVLHAIAVDPRYARKGFGEALLEQLLKNLQALGVDRVETEVDRDAFALLGWFHRRGFGPSDRLVFRRRG